MENLKEWGWRGVVLAYGICFLGVVYPSLSVIGIGILVSIISLFILYGSKELEITYYKDILVGANIIAINAFSFMAVYFSDLTFLLGWLLIFAHLFFYDGKERS